MTVNELEKRFDDEIERYNAIERERLEAIGLDSIPNEVKGAIATSVWLEGLRHFARNDSPAERAMKYYCLYFDPVSRLMVAEG